MDAAVELRDGVASGCGSYTGSAVQTAKHHLSVCLKLLGIMYRSDDTGPDRPTDSSLPTKVEPEASLWPSGTQGDTLYLAMVMLNSALLKALHVADSFQTHCHREFPKIVAPSQDSLLLDAGGVGDGWRPMTDEAGRVSSEDYRRLQAETFVLCETGWSLEQQREADKTRIRQLEDECRQLRAALAKPQASKDAAKTLAKPEPPEVSILREFGVGVEWLPEASAVVSNDEVQRIVSVKDSLAQAIKEARTEESRQNVQIEDATRIVVEGEKEIQELKKILSAPSSADSVQSLVRQLLNDVNVKREEFDARLRDLQAQDKALERQCEDLHIENSKLQALADHREQVGMGNTYEQDCEEPYHHNEAAFSSRSTGSGHRSSAHLGGQRSRGVDAHDMDSVGTTESSATAGDSRHAGRGYRHRTSQKPFVVCSSSRSHHASAHAHNRSRRAPQPLPEERMFAKAALRYAKNPADPQALGKLASLLQKSAGHTSGETRPSDGAAAADPQQEFHQMRPDSACSPGVSWSSPPVRSSTTQGRSSMSERR